MARLNEPPAAPAASIVLQPGAESVDARKSSLPTPQHLWELRDMRTKSKVVVQRPPANFEEVKRRFVRQNRELAKNNSNQSLRIRSLELEVSRLLADNLELRERAFRLEIDLFAAQRNLSRDAVRRVREELQAKLAELSGLVGGLDDVVGQQDDGHEAMQTQERKPIEGQWRERQTLTEAMRENQMPTIAEDKQYPRRTLGADEMQAIRLSGHSSNGSPELGPPPVAHFDYEDPVKHASPSANRTSPKAADDDVLPGLSVNFETRRKRKDAQPKLEIRRHSILSQSPETKESEGSTMLRTGAKRKLADRDVERSVKPPSKDDFTFSRKATSGEAKTKVEQIATVGSLPIVEDDQEPEAEATAAPPKPARKVLGDKSANMSPRKAAARPDKPGKGDPEKAAKPPAMRSVVVPARSQSRTRRASALPQPSPPREILLSTIEIPPPAEQPVMELPPKTPALADLFSPTPSEPSAKPNESRAGTPPPGDLSTLSTTTNGEGARPSRRARGAVNYAEPSLMAKMRRPTKQLVDAISGLQDPRRAMCVTSERQTAAARTVVIKQEPEDDDAWKSLPVVDAAASGSPLGQRSTSEGHGDGMLPVEVLSEPEPPAHNAPSAASANISELIAGGRKRRGETHTQVMRQQQQPLGTDIDAAVKKLDELDLYEFKDSSSPADAAAVPSSAKDKSHRRHSSVPKELPTHGGGLPAVGLGEAPLHSGGGGAAAAGLAGRSERAASRRRSMML
ncbi:hypothetical protein LTR08_006806 [Meristemomyces frigidus]|nr:hypothetical protein LTR08_006806 [Meristemomyces frigidus]